MLEVEAVVDISGERDELFALMLLHRNPRVAEGEENHAMSLEDVIKHKLGVHVGMDASRCSETVEWVVLLRTTVGEEDALANLEARKKKLRSVHLVARARESERAKSKGELYNAIAEASRTQQGGEEKR